MQYTANLGVFMAEAPGSLQLEKSMINRRNIGARFGSIIACGLLSGLMAVAWGAEREGRSEGRGRGPARTAYKEVPPAATRQVSYEKDVKPILMENCTRCHGSKKHKSDLRLDTVDNILLGSEDGPVVKPGKGAQSTLIRSIAGIGVEADKVMPPKDDMLTKDEIGILRAWIDQGAKPDAR